MWRNLEDGTKYQRDEKSGKKVRKLRVWCRKFNIQLSGILGREKRENGKGKITDELINEKISELKDHICLEWKNLVCTQDNEWRPSPRQLIIKSGNTGDRRSQNFYKEK